MGKLELIMWCVIVSLLVVLVTLTALGCTTVFAARPPTMRTVEKPLVFSNAQQAYTRHKVSRTREDWEPWEVAIQEAAHKACEAWQRWHDGDPDAYFDYKAWSDELFRRSQQYREEQYAANPGLREWYEHCVREMVAGRGWPWPPPWLIEEIVVTPMGLRKSGINGAIE